MNLSSLATTLLTALRGLILAPRRYEPERYYMRGPGPKWREKHAVPGLDRR